MTLRVRVADSIVSRPSKAKALGISLLRTWGQQLERKHCGWGGLYRRPILVSIWPAFRITFRIVFFGGLDRFSELGAARLV